MKSLKCQMSLQGARMNPWTLDGRRLFGRTGAVLAALLLASTGAGATGPEGPVGPQGPIGPAGLGRTDAPRQRSQPVAPQPAASASAPSASRASAGGNRIEVSGNTASGTHCTADGSTSVNSVDVAGARLEGRTVIVQGRNTNNVRTQDCPERPPQGPGTGGQTNSIRIR